MKSSSYCVLTLACFSLLSGNQDRTACADPVSLKTVDHVIQISVDGLRGDLLQRLLDDAPATYPNFKRLETQGAFTYNARADYTNTNTIPNHITMVTGRPVDQPAGQPNTVHHGYTSNSPSSTDTIHADGNPNVSYKSSTFDVAHDRGLSTSFYASKSRLTIIDRSYDQVSGATDTVGDDNGRDKIDFASITDLVSIGIVGTLVDNLNVSPANYTFFHIVEPDGAGHSAGWESPAWTQNIGFVDSYLGQIFSAVDTNPALTDNMAIILTGDHGGSGRSHTDQEAFENYNVPLFAWGMGLPASSDLYDLASNRFDPGTDRIDYDSPAQPWRNGDTANLAMTALDLPPIPGSFMRPEFHTIPEPAAGSLALLGLVFLLATRRQP